MKKNYYDTPLAIVLPVSADSVLCVSELSFGNGGQAGDDFVIDDDFSF
ncbi:MAG: hypothetical protein MJY41_03830 [Bacteroidales bacterium]|nr:hypothetical protein [Bacteroidales bacterium]